MQRELKAELSSVQRELNAELSSVQRDLKQFKEDDIIMLKGEAANATVAGIMQSIGGDWADGEWQIRQHEDGTKYMRFVPDRTITDLFHAYEFANGRKNIEPDYLLDSEQLTIYEQILSQKFGVAQHFKSADTTLKRILENDRKLRSRKGYQKLTKEAVANIVANELDSTRKQWLEKIGTYALQSSSSIERPCTE